MSQADQTGQSRGISLLWIVAVLLRDRRTLLLFTGIGMVLGLLVALLRAKTYTTTLSFIPQAAQDARRAGLASLAGQFGIPLGALGGAAESPQLYADLLTTRSVLAPIATDSFALGQDSTRREPLAVFLDADDDEPAISTENTLRALRTKVISASVAARTTGMVTVRVRTESPYVSLAIAERLLKGLNLFNLVTRQSIAREERQFTEKRLASAREELRSAEDVLQRFLQANRQVGESPALTFQRDRLQREVGLQQQVVSSLAQQYEENRIREVRDTPVITVFERPVLPAKPDSRLRLLILFLATALGFGTGAIIVAAREIWNRTPSTTRDPALALLSSEWRRIRGASKS